MSRIWNVTANLRTILPVLALIAGVVLTVGVVFAGLPANRPTSARSGSVQSGVADRGPLVKKSVNPQSGSAFSPGSRNSSQSVINNPRDPRARSEPRPRTPQQSHGIASPPSPPLNASVAHPNRVLYDQYNDQDVAGISSQNFEPALDQYDSEAADDFNVPAAETWSIDHVEVAGAYLGSGPADSVNVIFYADDFSMPGVPVFTQTNILYSPGPHFGDFVIPLNPPAVLSGGHYWVSVQANQHFDPSGQWLWRFRTSYENETAKWRNPGGGFGDRYRNWGSYCTPFGCPLDYPFRLDGGIAGTPEPTITAAATYTPSTPHTTATGTHFIPSPVATGFATVQPTATETVVPCGNAWRVEPAPTEVTNGGLYSVAVISPADLWTVGEDDLTATQIQSLAMHWDGSAWHSVPVPTPAPFIDEARLFAVSALSSTDVWAVGWYFDTQGDAQPVTVHWNGTQWNLVPIAIPPGSHGTYLSGVAAISPSDVWAVGDYDDGSYNNTLAEHWNGSQWTVVPSPSLTDVDNYLADVRIVSSNDVWAVGSYYDRNTTLDGTLTEHWDGVQWTIVPSPNDPNVENVLYDVDASSPTNVWAVGYSGRFSYSALPLVLKWNSSQWDIVPGPQVQGNPSTIILDAVKVLSPNAIWVAGYYGDPATGYMTLTAFWDGTQWTVVPSPNRAQWFTGLYSIDSMGPDYVWAVGSYGAPLTMRYNDPCASVTPIPPTRTNTPTNIPTNTQISTTRTSTPGRTGTPTRTSTPCAITFFDVHPTDYFYEPVRYLFCEGAISGYSDGTFRPYNNTTRGQLSKIVVLAVGWAIDTTGGPHFTDVPATNPFYAYIETAYNRGVISGYSDNTFRWGNNVTRGQLSKIIVSAEQWAIDTTGGPHFSDVGTDNPFYAYIETALNRSIISGYSDGTFRPGNNAIRAQICKIVYNAISP